MAKVEKRKVVAVFPEGKYGYFGNKRVFNGDPLTVTKQEFSFVWMKLADGERDFPKDKGPKDDPRLIPSPAAVD